MISWSFSTPQASQIISNSEVEGVIYNKGISTSTIQATSSLIIKNNGTITIGSSTPPTTDIFFVGTSTKALTVSSITGNVTMANQLNMQQGSSTTDILNMFVNTDTSNTSTKAGYLTVSGSGTRRMYFGTTEKPLYSVNFSNTQNLEGITAIKSSLFSLPNSGTPFFNIYGGGSGQQTNISSYYGIIIRPTMNTNPPTTYSAYQGISDYGLAIVGQRAGTEQLFVSATTSQTAKILNITDVNRNTYFSVGPNGSTTTKGLKAENYYSGDGSQGFTGLCTELIPDAPWVFKDGLLISC